MEIHLHINLKRPRWLTAWSRRRKLLVSSLLALVLIPSLIVLAHHLPFTDIPSSGALHDAVGAIYGARVTAGTTANTYSPDDPTTRGAMAFFLHRGLGRTGFDTNATVNLGTTETDLAVITLTAGGTTGGTGFVKLDASVTSSTTSTATTGCPCELRIQITRDGGGASDIFWANLYDGQGGVLGNVVTSATWTTLVATGTTHTFRLKAFFSDSEGTIPANETYGGLTAIYAPFGASGGATLTGGSGVLGRDSQAEGRQ